MEDQHRIRNGNIEALRGDWPGEFLPGGQQDEVDSLDGDEALRLPLEMTLCNVCGDVAAGFHCGAYVCEACKKFFVRCLKHDSGLKFACANERQCEITKETRTQCPHCRYQKCLSLGMYRPGGPNVSDDIGHIPCKVCGAPSSGFHFGAITCEGCKGFFRRTVKERGNLKYVCSRVGDCTITWKTRNVCKFCRYQKCVAAGMMADKSRIGRQPNSIKHATMLELHQIKAAKGLAIPPDSQTGDHGSRNLSESHPKVEPKDEEEEKYSRSLSRSNIVSRRSAEDLFKASEEFRSKSSGRRKHKNKDLEAEQKLLGESYAKRRGSYGENISRSTMNLSDRRYEDCSGSMRSLNERAREEERAFNLYEHTFNEPLQLTTGRNDLVSDTRHMSIFNQAKQLLEQVNHQYGATCMDYRDLGDGRTYRGSRGNLDQNEVIYRCDQSNQHYDLADAVQQCNFIGTSELAHRDRGNHLDTVNHIKRNASYNDIREGRNPYNIQDGSRVESSYQQNYNKNSFPSQFTHSTDYIDDKMSCGIDQITDLSITSIDEIESSFNFCKTDFPPQTNLPDNPLCDQSQTVIQSKADSQASPQTTSSSPLMDYNVVIDAMKRAFNDLNVLNVRPENLHLLTEKSTELEMWESQMTVFAYTAGNVLKFAKKVPGFRSFSLEQQIEIVQTCMFPIVLVSLSMKYDVSTSGFNWWNYTHDEFLLILKQFEVFKVLVPWFHRMGHILNEFKPDGVEIAFLCALCLVNACNRYDYKELLLDSLNEYCRTPTNIYAFNKSSSGDGSSGDESQKYKEDEAVGGENPSAYSYRSGRILLILRYMSESFIAHQQAIGQLVTDPKYAHLEIPRLYKESFIGLDDDY